MHHVAFERLHGVRLVDGSDQVLLGSADTFVGRDVTVLAFNDRGRHGFTMSEPMNQSTKGCDDSRTAQITERAGISRNIRVTALNLGDARVYKLIEASRLP